MGGRYRSHPHFSCTTEVHAMNAKMIAITLNPIYNILNLLEASKQYITLLQESLLVHLMRHTKRLQNTLTDSALEGYRH